MCGRFANSLSRARLTRLFGVAPPEGGDAPHWNIAPGMDALVLRRHPETGERHLDPLRWGLLPHFIADPARARRPINARAETVATAPLFRDAFARRRCLVPAEAFYEWRRGPAGKIPYAAARADGEPLALAGVWEGWRGADGAVERSFAILTTEANAVMAPIHDRMPVIVEEADWPVWLGEAPGDVAALLRPAAENVLRVWPVSRAVNNPRHEGAALLEPVEGGE
jgi:putative SOS response-associated peptidase YedK